MKELWVEKYRPKTIDGYVFKDQNQKKKIEQWIKSGALPHMLLSGSPGTGKSTLIKLLLNELKVDPFDIMEVNASKDNGVDFIRYKISNFSETMGVGQIRYIFLDEADGLTEEAQNTLRGTMEKYASSVRFLLTCNRLHKIYPAIKSRCEAGTMHIEKLDRDEFEARLVEILANEGIEIDFDPLVAIADKTYPDLRRGISMCQANSYDGKLNSPDEDSEKISDHITDAIVLFRSKRYKEGRELICSKIKQDEYENIYRFMYDNTEIWADNDHKENLCIIAIRDGIEKHAKIADSEINLSATLIELEMISKG